MSELERLEQAIVEAEQEKREYVKSHPNGEGDKKERIQVYNKVELARKALRAFKIKNNMI